MEKKMTNDTTKIKMARTDIEIETKDSNKESETFFYETLYGRFTKETAREYIEENMLLPDAEIFDILGVNTRTIEYEIDTQLLGRFLHENAAQTIL